MSDRIITMACLYKESVKEVSKLQKEIDLKDKRISLLTETLASRDKDIETLKAEIIRQNNIIVDYMNTNASLRELAAEEKKVIKAMALWIYEHTCLLLCVDDIIKRFESEVKE